MESTLLEHRSIKLLLIDKVIGDFFFFWIIKDNLCLTIILYVNVY